MDVLALEALRVFDPDVHEALPRLAAVLTGDRGGALDFRPADEREAEAKKLVDGALENSTNAAAATHILRSLFPAAGRIFGSGSHAPNQRHWRRDRRVAARPILEHYLHAAIGSDEVARRDVDAALAAFAHPEQLQALLDGTEPRRLYDLLSRLRDEVDAANVNDLPSLAIVFLAVPSRMPRRESFFALRPMRMVLSLIEGMLHRLQDEQARIGAVESVLQQAPTLTTRFEVLMFFGTHDEDGSSRPEIDIVPLDRTAELRDQLAAAIRAAPPQQLAEEEQLKSLLLEVQERVGDDAAVVLLGHDAVAASALEKSIVTQESSNEFGGARERRLHADPLIKLLGADALRERAATLKEQLDESASEDLRLAIQQILDDSYLNDC